MKKYIYITLFAFTLLGLLVAYNPDLRTIGADSGWDSSYSSSDHSSSSRSDRDSSSSYADDILSDFGLIEDIIFEVIIFITFTIIIIKILNKDILVFSINIVRTIIVILFEILVSPKMIFLSLFSMVILILVVAFYCMKKKDDPYKFINNYTKCSDEVLKKAGITSRSELEKTLYNIFVDIQMAWMKFDYEALSKLCTNELYNSYKADLEVLKLKNGQNIMSDFNLQTIIINSVKKNDDTLIVKAYLNVSFKDYVINTNTNEVIRGQINQPLNNKYHLEFTKKIKPLSNCPSCGSKLENIKDNKCPHCKAIIINNNKNYVLSHKEII